MAKKRRLITRRRLKWLGTVLCVLVLGIGVASAWYGGGWWWTSHPKWTGSIGINRGRLILLVNHYKPPYGKVPRPESIRFGVLEDPSIDLKPRWSVFPSTTGTWFRSSTLPGSSISPSSSTFTTPGSFSMFLPLWIPLLLIAAPTAWLWRTDRRAKPWQCATCRYDLRGLASEGNGKWGGVCPECGELTQGEV